MSTAPTFSMAAVLKRIEERKAMFAQLALFRRLEGEGSVDDVRAFAPALTFFVMAFQDILRINAAHVRDPKLAAFARHHRDEDAGHDAWFLHDLHELDVDVSIASLFGSDYRTTRDTSYALVAEALHVDNDYARLALLFSLEATGDAIFRRAPGFLERAGFRGEMRYFAKRHYDIECAHDLHDDAAAAALAQVALDEASYRSVMATVELTFDAMTRMVDAFEIRIMRQRSGVINVGRARTAPSKAG